MQRAKASLVCLAAAFVSAFISCSDATEGEPSAGAAAGRASHTGGAQSTGGTLTNNSGAPNSGGNANGGNANGGNSNGGSDGAKGGGNSNGGTNTTKGGDTSSGGVSGSGGANMSRGGGTSSGGASGNGGATASKGGATNSGGTMNAGGSTSSGAGTNNGGTTANGGSIANGGKSANGGTTANGGKSANGGTTANGGSIANGGASSGGNAATGGSGGATTMWPNIRVVGNQMRDRRGNAFAIRSIESMFGNGSSDAVPFIAGHKALGANTVGPMPNPSLANADAVEALVDAAYKAGLVIGLNADHANQGERFFQDKAIQAVVNHYPNVFLQEAVELGSDMTEAQWVDAAKHKVDAYLSLYPDKPLKIGSPDGGRSPRYALDRCQDIVDYYKSKGGRGGLIFTCQLYWKAATASWSYQNENGFKDGLPGILQAIDAMAASPCFFMPGLDNQDDVGYTGWREVMDHIRDDQSDPATRTSFQWWVYFNSGDSYANDLTTKPNDALSGITATGRDVKAKLEMDRTLIDLGPLNQ